MLLRYHNNLLHCEDLHVLPKLTSIITPMPIMTITSKIMLGARIWYQINIDSFRFPYFSFFSGKEIYKAKERLNWRLNAICQQILHRNVLLMTTFAHFAWHAQNGNKMTWSTERQRWWQKLINLEKKSQGKLRENSSHWCLLWFVILADTKQCCIVLFHV